MADAQNDRGQQEPDGDAAPEQVSDAFESHQTVAETVGGVPSLRLKDNVIQAIAIVLGTIAGAIVGLVVLPRDKWVPELYAALIGAVGGLIASAILSGMVLMVVGWVRAARKIGKGDEQ